MLWDSSSDEEQDEIIPDYYPVKQDIKKVEVSIEHAISVLNDPVSPKSFV